MVQIQLRGMPRQKFHSLSALGAVLLSFIGGCSFSPSVKPHYARTQEEAGSIGFSIVSVGDWESYKNDLQPRFKLSADDALNKALKPTESVQESILNAWRLAAALDPKMSSSTRTRTTDTAADGTVTNKISETATDKPGADSAPSAPSENALPSTLQASLPDKAADMGLAAAFSYRAAVALYQEVQLIDRYVEDAVKRTGYEAYVVRLHISLMPNARYEPYDAFANISFSNDTGQVAGWSVPESNASDSLSDTMPIVVPLLATDEIETTQHSKQINEIRQLALALSLLKSGNALGGDFQQISQHLQLIIGTDMNSLLTVGRVTDHMIRVRIGAMQSVASQDLPVMVPKNQSVTLLLLAPRGQVVTAAMSTEFRDVDTGKALDARDAVDVRDAIARILRQYKSKSLGNCDANSDDAKKELMELLAKAQNGSTKDFMNQLDIVCGTNDRESPNFEAQFGAQIRNQVQAVLVGGNYAISTFELPKLELPEVPAVASALIDDGDQATITLSGGNRVSGIDFGATWLGLSTDIKATNSSNRKNAGTTTPSGAASVHLLPLKRAYIKDDNTAVELTYASPSSLGLGAAAGTINLHSGNYRFNYPIAIVKSGKDKNEVAAGFSWSLGAASPNTTSLWVKSDRTAKLTFGIQLSDKQPAKRVGLEVSGATIEAISCDSKCVAGVGDYRVTGSGHITLILSNVGEAVTIKAQGTDGSDALRIVLPVREQHSTADDKGKSNKKNAAE